MNQEERYAYVIIVKISFLNAVIKYYDSSMINEIKLIMKPNIYIRAL